jgi:hypothetical protein
MVPVHIILIFSGAGYRHYRECAVYKSLRGDFGGENQKLEKSPVSAHPETRLIVVPAQAGIQ